MPKRARVVFDEMPSLNTRVSKDAIFVCTGELRVLINWTTGGQPSNCCVRLVRSRLLCVSGDVENQVWVSGKKHDHVHTRLSTVSATSASSRPGLDGSNFALALHQALKWCFLLPAKLELNNWKILMDSCSQTRPLKWHCSYNLLSRTAHE
jgi:hypothetical protein